MVCSCSLNAQDLVFPRKCRTRSVTSCVLTGVTWHKLLRDLKMAASCTGLGGVLERPSCKLRLAATSARPGAT